MHPCQEILPQIKVLRVIFCAGIRGIIHRVPLQGILRLTIFDRAFEQAARLFPHPSRRVSSHAPILSGSEFTTGPVDVKRYMSSLSYKVTAQTSPVRVINAKGRHKRRSQYFRACETQTLKGAVFKRLPVTALPNRPPCTTHCCPDATLSKGNYRKETDRIRTTLSVFTGLAPQQ